MRVEYRAQTINCSLGIERDVSRRVKNFSGVQCYGGLLTG